VKGVCGRAKIFGSALTTAVVQCLRVYERFFIVYWLGTGRAQPTVQLSLHRFSTGTGNCQHIPQCSYWRYSCANEHLVYWPLKKVLFYSREIHAYKCIIC